MPPKATQPKAIPPKAKTLKSVYEITPGDLPHYTGGIAFENGTGQCTKLAEAFPNYDHRDPRTHVFITRATLSAALGHDYTGEQVLPPYVAYPPKVMRDFRNYPSRVINAATMGKYHRLYPHNCDPKGKLRKTFGMSVVELINYLNLYADALKKQPTRLKPKAQRKNKEKWRASEEAEERRENEAAKMAISAEDVDSAETEDCDAKFALQDQDATKAPSSQKETSGSVDDSTAKGKKRSADDDAAVKHSECPSKRAKLTANVGTTDDSDDFSDI